MIIINTDNSIPRRIVEKAISRFRKAYKIPTLPRIRHVDSDSVKYDWKAIKASFALGATDVYAKFAVWKINSIFSGAPQFEYKSEDELINEIIACLEYWVNNCMEP